MRIAIFTDTYLPDINGVVSSVELLRKKLEELGNTVYVVCTYKGVARIKYEGNIIRLPGVEIEKLYGYAVATPLHFLLIDELKALDLDIIHAETEFGVGIFANIVASNLNLPLVRTYHTTYEDYTHYLNILNSKTLDKFLKKGVAEVSKAYCNHCVKLICPSEKTAGMLRTYGVNSEITIIPTGIELDRFAKENADLDKAQTIREEYGITEDEKLLLFVGRIAEEKSIDMIIEAFRKVKENGLKVRLLIVGDGPQLEDLKKMVNGYQLDEYVFFAGKKPFAEVPAYYHAANGFISASTSETQGMTYIEALASGLVVLAHYDQVLDDLIIEGENGYFFETTDDIYKTIVTFDSLSKEEYERMAEVAIDSAGKYDANKFGRDSMALYEEAIEDYKHSYIVKKTTLKDDCVVLELLGYDGETEKIMVSLDDYYNGGFRNESKVTRLIYDALKKKENYTKAYRSCLKKLANRDYSVRQLKEHLRLKYELSDRNINEIIDKLNEYGMVDDYRFALNKVSSFNATLMSRKAMRYKLKKLGISDEIIEKTVLNNPDSELMNAKAKAKKYLSSCKNKSLNVKKQTIYAKLVNDGFSYDIAREAMSVLDFSESVMMEKDILKKEALKAKKKYEKKYEGTELRNRVYLSLVSKGFSYDNIYAIINEMEL
ncbi:MAG: RecX family transcriptional regulator [Erysipelotrichaceae bacterium]|nr:RecX family transcriptional regulator [Erysipelotrichaceae bacterium]